MTSNPLGGHGGQPPSQGPAVIDLTQTDSEMGDSESEESVVAMETDATGTGRTIEYEDDEEFLNNGDDIPQHASPDEKRAHKFKEDGNNFFKIKQYKNAITNYDNAIALDQFNHEYYGNRSACYLLLGQYDDALKDAKKAIQINQTYEKGYQRIFRSSLHLGSILACDAVINLVNGLPNDVKVDISQEMENLQCLKDNLAQVNVCKENNDYKNALICIDVAMNVATVDIALAAAKADILYRLDQYEEAEALAAEILQKKPDQAIEAKALFVSGRCEYQREDLEKSQTTLRRAGQLSSLYDSTPIQNFYNNVKKLGELMKTGNEHNARKDTSTAKKLYTEAVKILEETDMKNDLFHSKLCYKLSRTAFDEKSKNEALTLCSKAIELNPTYAEAYEIRASFYFQDEMFKQCVRDYDKLTKLEPTNRTWQNKLNEANLAAKKTQQKDYYKILGVERNASEEKIRQAYKKLVLEYHPDRHPGASDSVKERNEKHFKDVGEAYAILKDSSRRSTFDHGGDLRAGLVQYDPTQSMFYSGGAHSSHQCGYSQYYQTPPGGGPR